MNLFKGLFPLCFRQCINSVHLITTWICPAAVTADRHDRATSWGEHNKIRELVRQSEVVSELCGPSKMAWSGTPRTEGTTKKPAELCQQDSQRLCMDGSCIPRMELCRKFRSCAWVELWRVVTVARWNLILITLLKKCRPSKMSSPVSPWICLKSLLKPIYIFLIIMFCIASVLVCAGACVCACGACP